MKTTIRYVLVLTALLLSFSSNALPVYMYQTAGSGYNIMTSSADSTCQETILILRPDRSYIFQPNSNYSNQAFTGVVGVCSSFTTAPVSPNVNLSRVYLTQCPTSHPYEWQDGFCYVEEEPPQECPDGQIMQNEQCTIQCVQGQQITLTMQFADVQQKITDPFIGCKLEMSAGPLACNSLMSSCNITYTDTGVYDENFSWPNGVEPEPTPPVQPAPEPITTETVDGPITETVNNPDGSTTTTETTTTTNVNDQGHLVEIIGDSIVIKNQAGEIIEILQQYETNTYTDGTSLVTETTTTTATPNSITEVKKNLTDGSTTTTTRTYNKGLSGTTTTTKTTTYNAQGQPTGSATITDGGISETDGSGDGGGEEGGELCGAPGQPICDVKIHEDQADYDANTQQIESLETEYTTMMDDFLELDTSDVMGVADMDWTSADYWIANFLNIPMVTNCTGVISSVIFGRPFVLDPCERLIPLREILAWVFSIMTFFAILAIIFHRKLL